MRQASFKLPDMLSFNRPEASKVPRKALLT